MTRCALPTCGHLRSLHWTMPDGEPVCSGVACDCTGFQPGTDSEHRPWTPVRFRDGYDPGPEPARSIDMGAHRPADWPEPSDLVE